MSTSNEGQIAVILEFAAESQLSLVINLGSEDGVFVNIDDSTNLNSDLILLFRSVRNLSNVVIATSSVDSTSQKSADGELVLVSGEMFSKDGEISFSITEEEVVSGEVVSLQVKLGNSAELESVVVEGQLVVKVGNIAVFQVKSGLDVELTSRVFNSQISTKIVESVVGLDLSSDVQRLADIVSTEVSPDSDDTLAVEFGFNISAFDVGDEFGFSRGNGVFFLVSTDLEVKSSLTVEDKRLTLASIFDSQELLVNVVIIQESSVFKTELVESGLGATNGSKVSLSGFERRSSEGHSLKEVRID